MPTPLFAGPQVAAAVERELAPPLQLSRGGPLRRAARALYARPTRANSMKRPLTTYCTPRSKKKFAQKQRRRRKRARRGPGPPSRRAPPPTGGGHPARAGAGCSAHAGASASLQHYDGSGRDFSHGARAPCFQSAKGYTFWAPLLWTLLLRSAAAPCVLGKLPHCLRLPRPFLLFSSRARRCFPRSAPSPANASVTFPPETARLAAHRQLAAAP